MSHQKSDHIYAIRHSLAHIMAAAIKRQWPEAKFGVGPVIDNGFYYDIDLGDKKISEEQFERIETEMKKIIAEGQPFEHFVLPITEAIGWAEKTNQPYKKELLNDLGREGTTVAKDLDKAMLGIEAASPSKIREVSFYKNGDFTDLCRGPHVEKTTDVGPFKLMRVAGAYWRGKEQNPQMQRLYGVAFESQEELDAYLEQLIQAEARDHRKLGKQLDLYAFSPLVGAGLPLYTPRGTVVRNALIQFSEQIRKELGFERVWSPHITKKDLYEVSGHWAKFGNELFLVKSQETSDQLVMKPMNCPHHNQIYAAKPRSYRDLPLKLMETATAYRDEKTGELHGLSRVRSLTQDDSHAYCTTDQVDEVVAGLIKQIKHFYQTIDMELKVRLSLRDDSDQYLGDPKLWAFAEERIEALAQQNNLDFHKEKGEAAFYGPKIDFMAIDAIGREWQVATVQFDFVMPQRFGLNYINAEGKEEVPIMIHCAIMGSFDRFFSVYIEHTAGWFPFWAAPEQIRILTINDKVTEYVKEITTHLDNVVLMKPIKYNELRYSVDDRNESLGRKIHDAVDFKIPAVFIVGPKDAEARQISIRLQGKEQKVDFDKMSDFLQQL